MRARAIYAFSGDPITFGHLDLIRRAQRAFGSVLVAIGRNPAKHYLFSREERLALAQEAIRGMEGVEAVAFDGLLTDLAYEQGIPLIIRGIRDGADFNAEQILYQVAKAQWPAVDFHLLPADPRFAHISSGAAKALQLEQGDVSGQVPLHVKAALELKLSGQVLLGVTGEMGAGKSHVSRALVTALVARGIPAEHIDLDLLGHQALESEDAPAFREARARIAEAFGLGGEGAFLDRNALGQAALGDRAGAARLSELLREPLGLLLKRRLRGRRGLFLFDSALLAELDLSRLCNHRVLLVRASRALEAERLAQRGAVQRWSLQLNAEEKEARLRDRVEADAFGRIWRLDNDGRPLEAALQALVSDWSALFPVVEARHGTVAA